MIDSMPISLNKIACFTDFHAYLKLHLHTSKFFSKLDLHRDLEQFSKG